MKTSLRVVASRLAIFAAVCAVMMIIVDFTGTVPHTKALCIAFILQSLALSVLSHALPMYSYEWGREEAEEYLKFAKRMRTRLYEHDLQNHYEPSLFNYIMFPNEKNQLRELFKNSQDLITETGGKYSSKNIDFWTLPNDNRKGEYLNKVIDAANIALKSKWT